MLDVDGLAKTFSGPILSRFSDTVACASPWESSAFVSLNKALGLMILDAYGGGADAENPFFFVAFRTAPQVAVSIVDASFPSRDYKNFLTDS